MDVSSCEDQPRNSYTGTIATTRDDCGGVGDSQRHKNTSDGYYEESIEVESDSADGMDLSDVGMSGTPQALGHMKVLTRNKASMNSNHPNPSTRPLSDSTNYRIRSVAERGTHDNVNSNFFISNREHLGTDSTPEAPLSPSSFTDHTERATSDDPLKDPVADRVPSDESQDSVNADTQGEEERPVTECEFGPERTAPPRTPSCQSPNVTHKPREKIPHPNPDMPPTPPPASGPSLCPNYSGEVNEISDSKDERDQGEGEDKDGDGDQTDETQIPPPSVGETSQTFQGDDSAVAV